MRNSTLLSAFAFLSAASAVGVDEYGNSMPCPSNLCFDNFYADINGSFYLEDFNDDDMVCMWNFPINLRWHTISKSNSSTFTLEWLVQDLLGTPRLQRTCHASLTVPGGPDNSTKVVWSQNITSKSFVLQPFDNSSFWPTTAAPNMTHFEAIGYASGLNQFRVSETGALNTSDILTYDLTRPFTMKQYWRDRTLQWEINEINLSLEQTRRVNTYLAVAVAASGLGVGLVAWFLGRWLERRNLGRIGGSVGWHGRAKAFEPIR
jgi:hypothetical protein